MEQIGWTGLGENSEVTSERQFAARDRAKTDEDYHRLSKTHFWVVFISHRASSQLLDALDGKTDNRPMLDSETMLGPPATGCLICEQPYDAVLRKRSCPGDPV